MNERGLIEPRACSLLFANLLMGFPLEWRTLKLSPVRTQARAMFSFLSWNPCHLTSTWTSLPCGELLEPVDNKASGGGYRCSVTRCLWLYLAYPTFKKYYLCVCVCLSVFDYPVWDKVWQLSAIYLLIIQVFAELYHRLGISKCVFVII